MKVEEAAITGESVPVNKVIDILTLKENSLDIPLGDRTNMLYSGSTVVYGRGKAVVSGVRNEYRDGENCRRLKRCRRRANSTSKEDG